MKYFMWYEEYYTFIALVAGMRHRVTFGMRLHGADVMGKTKWITGIPGWALAAFLLVAGVVNAIDISAIGKSIESGGDVITDEDSTIIGGSYTVGAGHVVVNGNDKYVTIEDDGASGIGALFVKERFENWGHVLVSSGGSGGSMVYLAQNGATITNSGTFYVDQGTGLALANGTTGTFINNGLLTIFSEATVKADMWASIENLYDVTLYGDQQIDENIILKASSTGTLNIATVSERKAVDVGAGKLRIARQDAVFQGLVKSTNAADDAITVAYGATFNAGVDGNMEVKDGAVFINNADHTGNLKMAAGELNDHRLKPVGYSCD